MDYSGQIHFKRDDGTARAVVDLAYAPSLNAVETFAAVCHTMTTAEVQRCTFVEGNDVELAAAGGEVYDLNFAAHFKFRYVDAGGGYSYRRFRLPAPKLAIFEEVLGKGYRVKQSYGETMATALSALRGETLTFHSGWMVS